MNSRSVFTFRLIYFIYEYIGIIYQGIFGLLVNLCLLCGMKKKEPQTELVKHGKTVKNKVARAVIGTAYTIGGFYDAAAEEKLKAIKMAKKKTTDG